MCVICIFRYICTWVCVNTFMYTSTSMYQEIQRKVSNILIGFMWMVSKSTVLKIKQFLIDHKLNENPIYGFSIYDKNNVLFLPLTTQKAAYLHIIQVCINMRICMYIYICVCVCIYHRRRRSYFKKFRLPKFPTSFFTEVPLHIKDVFTGVPKFSCRFSRVLTKSPSLKRSIGKTDRSWDPNISSLISSVSGICIYMYMYIHTYIYMQMGKCTRTNMYA